MRIKWNVLLRTPVLFGLTLIAMAGLFLLKLNTLPPQIPLYYSLPNSDQQIVNVYYIFLLPLITLIFITINYFFGYRIIKDDFARTVTYVQNISIIVLMFYIFVKILFLVA